MFRKTEDFITDWGYESDGTLNLFKLISNEALNKKDNENVRSMAVLTWHITITLSEMMKKAGLDVSGPDEHSKPPSNMDEIIEAYETSSRSVVEQVKKQWTDASLLEEKNMYGDTWKNGVTLSVLIKHQAHHRGQLTVLMRQSGMKVTGIYGPVKEDWATYGMPAAD